MKNDLFEIQVLGHAEGFWRYRQATTDHAYDIAAPVSVRPPPGRYNE